MPGQDYDREALLGLTPAAYLRDGFLDADGKPRHELTGIWATAACVQIEEEEASPQEVAATFEALRYALPLHRGSPAEKFRAAWREALETVAAMYDIRNNQGVVDWLEACGEFVQTEADIEAFVAHFQAVMRQYAVIVGVKTQ